MACTRTDERALASFGIINTAESRFERCDDVTNGGVLAALPALVENGLYHNVEKTFPEFNGYYSVTHILTLLAFMGLMRIPTVEQLRKQPPGELGKLIGLDRIPEVKKLREKLSILSEDGAPEKWETQLSKKWMEDSPELAGALYCDGHSQAYGGKEKIPKAYLSRERLCMRAVTNFWINDILGQPFFVVRQAVNHGMLKVLREKIIPRLLKEVPNQPTPEQLAANKQLHRFIIIFDREGYSPEFFNEMWTKHRIACMTYQKSPGNDWDKKEFNKTEVRLINNEITTMELAERGTFIGKKKMGIWTKNIRKLTEKGHQTSIVSTAYSLSSEQTSRIMFARWCQEAFFKYMMENFGIDTLVSYKKKPVLETEYTTSPEWRRLQKEKNSLAGKIKTRENRFGKITMNLETQLDDKKYKEWEKTKQELFEEIMILKEKLVIIKEKIKETSQYVKVVDLPVEEQFQQITSSKKNFVDTIKMISYRAETSMVAVITKEFGSFGGARTLLQNIFTTDADLIPNTKSKSLIVRLHNLSTEGMNRKVDELFKYLNDAKIKYPGSNLILQYERVGK